MKASIIFPNLNGEKWLKDCIDSCINQNFDDEYEINPDDFVSKGRSTPFKGMKVYGKCLMTMCGGNIVWQEEEND